jgi:hypothetical protein
MQSTCTRLFKVGLISASLFVKTGIPVVADEVVGCREALSKKARPIYDRVLEKRADAADIRELWKEVTRDLISENLFGREEAMAPAEEAYSCLQKESG